MMKKRINRNALVAMFFSIISISLCGCVKFEYTEEQEDIIANYAAKTVLRHDVNYRDRYINEEGENIEETEPQTEMETQKETEPGGEITDIPSNGENGSESNVESDLVKAFRLPEGISARFVDYDIVDRYSSDDDSDNVVIKALENGKIMVIKFEFTNTTNSDINLNMMSQIKKYKGIVNDVKKYNEQLTLLLNALNTYEGVLKAGRSNQFVLIYHTQIDKKEDVRTLSVALDYSDGSDSVIILK